MINCSCCRGSRFKHSKSGCGSAPTSILPDWLGQLSSICLTSRQPGALGRQQVGVFLAQGQIRSSGAPTEAGTCSLLSFCLHLGFQPPSRRQTMHASDSSCPQWEWTLPKLLDAWLRSNQRCLFLLQLIFKFFDSWLDKFNHHESLLFSDRLTWINHW